MGRVAADLTVVTSYFNPIQYATRQDLHRAFVEHMCESGVRLIVVECQLGEREFDVTDAHHPDHVQVRCSSMAWIKENLINLGFAHALRTQPGTQYLAWVDGDIVFRRKDWAQATVQALQHYKIVQPWSDVYDLGPHGDHLSHFKSFCCQWFHGRPFCKHQRGPYDYWHSGYAWACRRDILERLGGLFDLAVLGSADHHMAMALIGKAKESVHGKLGPSTYLDHVLAWEDRARLHVHEQIGYVPGTIEHSWHGRKADRKYWDRWQIFISEAFDPDRDLKRNLHGVIELAGNKPGLRHKIDHYFRQRNEDGEYARMILDVRVRAVLLALYLAGLWLFVVHGQTHTVTLKGELFSADAECTYFLDPEGDSLTLTLAANSGDYLCDWLEGTANRGHFTITLTPSP